MISISAALRNLINGKKNFCCLCFNTIHGEPIRLTDDIFINIIKDGCDKAVEDVFKSIFDEWMLNYLTTFNTICEECMKLAISVCKFILTSQMNAKYFTKILYALTNSIAYATNGSNDSKSLFVSFDIQDFTSKHYYDLKQVPSTRKSVIKHYRNLDKKKLTCQVCHKSFPTVTNLKNHNVRVHAPKKFKCHECPRSYGSAAFLESHRNESHCTVVCSECGKTFYNRHTLKMHEQGHHLTLVCQDCGRIYKSKATFKKHIEHNVCGQETRAKPSEGKFTCDYCNKKYTQKMSLRVHIQYEHGNYKAHICEWCGKKFCSQSRLKAHTVKHTKEKNFPCTICGGKFVTKESLLYHTRTHTGEKPYKCPHCEYRFLSASRRSDHVKRHHLGGTLECDICHSKFKSRPFLYKHKKTHIRPSDKFNLTYGVTETNTPEGNYTKENVSVLTKNNLKPETSNKHSMCPNVVESTDIQLHNYIFTTYKEQYSHQSPENEVYFEVSEDNDYLIKLSDIGT